MQYINGLWVDEGSHSFTSTNPATGAVLWQGKAADAAQVEAAVAAARAAFPGWAARSHEARLAVLEAFKALISGAQEDLATAIAEETGKAMWDAKSEAAAAVAKLTYTNEAYAERTGTKSRHSPVGNAVVRHKPHGVMAVYGPYNFPAHLPNGHIMPALLAGNTVVFKPSEQTPMVGEWMVKQWHKAGLPAGVLNLVQGERDTGIALSKAAVDGILFTGSSATGRAIHAQFAGRPEIILALEMGGNNPLIVSEISNLDAAVLETILSAFTGTGQRCTCARRLILPAWAGRDAFIESLLKTAASLTIGAYNATPAPFMGPVISLREATRLLEAQNQLEKLGGKVLLRMRLLQEGLPFVTPAIIDMTGVKNVPDEEYFGPLLQLYQVDSPDEAAVIANQTRFGLSAAVLCDDYALFQRLSSQLHAGLINWNRQTTGASGAGPFGGVGVSGNHRPAGYYAADYCAYPVASVEVEGLALPTQLPPGLVIG
ncbi:MAG: succinylglutamate-semialdehyde dehydrogenase [Alphaproteobacteria bacterium]|nr:succinylglutamate-semialdehyde dehydrogenase [Alphaproteobacteria bacterium]